MITRREAAGVTARWTGNLEAYLYREFPKCTLIVFTTFGSHEAARLT